MRITVFVLILLLSRSLSGQSPFIVGHNQKFVYQNELSGFVLIESLAPGMTLYGLSRKYNVAIENILAANPDLHPNSIPLGHPVNIPISAAAISFKAPEAEEEMTYLCYRVQAKETLYRISTLYLHTTPEIIISLNPMTVQGLTIGQVLHIGWLLPVDNNINRTEISSGMTGDSLSLIPRDFIKEASTEGRVIKEQKGLAIWKPGPVTPHYFVLHSSAKVGTYMEITNPMLRRTITAKVAGNIPAGLYQSHVGIVVSPSTARALGVLDQQFFARWRYVQ